MFLLITDIAPIGIVGYKLSGKSHIFALELEKSLKLADVLGFLSALSPFLSFVVFRYFSSHFRLLGLLAGKKDT